MAIGGNEWLAQTIEPALEPNLPICDPHHHLWDRRAERPNYERYLLDELLADIDASGHKITSTVFIEVRSMYRASGPAEMRPVGEVEFVQGIAAMSASGNYGGCRAAAAIVGHADLMLGARVESVLDALRAASPNRFRGIRHSVTWDPAPELASVTPKEPRMLANANFREGARVLAKKGMTFEAWLYHPQLAELAEFARAVPDLSIVLNHIGGLSRIGPYANRDAEVLPAWREGIADVAKCANVVVKLGGMGMTRNGFDWHARAKPIGSEELAASMAPYMDHCVEQFGPDRCMFESNFPVDKVSFSYGVMWNAFKRLSKKYTASERAAMFHDTAVRVYQVKEN